MKTIVLILALISVFGAKASHIVGGDIYYDYIGGNNYRFYITVYRDCNSTGAAYDDPLVLTVYLQNSSSFLYNLSVPFPGSTILPVVFNNPCVIPPTDICVEKAVYTVVINLPPTVGGYTVSYQRCCRGPNITNLQAPDNTGLTLTTHVPGSETNATINSSPRFLNYPPLLLCNNDDLIFNHSAVDPDGDQLVYSLVTPFAGANSLNPLPNPAPPPNYFPVNWAGGFSAANPLGPGASIAIDPTTGILTASPQLLGLFVVGIRVQEYRNGVLIGQTIRDFLFKVFNCNITMEAILPTQEQLPTFSSYCQGLSVTFVNNSYGATNYAWNFGVTGITTDVSSAVAPTYTYPAPGIYSVMLVANPGWACTDTAYMEVNINNEFSVSFTSQDSLCILNNSFDFIGQTDGPASAIFSWNFGPNASIVNATGLTVNNVNFSSSGNIPVTLSGQYGECDATFTDSIFIYPEPIAEIVLSNDFECEGLTINFGNNSSGTTSYNWDFGVSGILSDISNQFAPTYTYPSPGIFEVTLIGSSAPGCSDTAVATINLNELLSISFTNNDSLCITGNSFNFDGVMTGPSFTQYLWNFGANASISTATDLDVNGVVFNTFGLFPITLTASFDNCVEIATGSVFVYREPSIDFRVEPGNRCAPALVQFTDLSLADSPIFYTWDFGNGNISNLENPSFYYSNPGDYSVGLTIQTNEGCVDTLTLFQEDLITIHPSPISQFTIDPIQTDICHADVTFTDLSAGAATIFYWFDDSTYFANQAFIVHNYQTSGWHRPMQIATNQFGCKDTSYQELYIEPFVIYIPNTFSPDGDEFNNCFNAAFALEVYEWEFKIFNRWGETLFISHDPAIGWDGTYNGKLMQDGIYSYVLRYVSCEKQDAWQILSGHVNLLK